MPELKNKESSDSYSISNANGDAENSSSAAMKSKNGKEISPYQKLLETLQFDSKAQWELALGKRVGFYALRGELGCGNFSRVKAGVHALTKEKVAVKILDKKKMDKKTRRLLCREISSMEKLHHPNIVHLYEVIHTDTRLHLVMEYASGGELFTKLSTQGMMNEGDAKIIFAQIVSAVQHMHHHNIIHRDLKAENVFYSEKKLVKVGDFGFSTEATSIRQALNTFCGSPPYAAPELFRDSFYFGESVDIWAVGIMLFFAVTGTMPFRAETVGKLKKRILSGEYAIPTHVSSECKHLIRSILKPNPIERFSITDIKSSDWLANVVYPKPMGYFRLEPTRIDINSCLPEEAYALYHLEKLGLGQEELKKFHFSNGSSQSPFSWDSKLDANHQVARKSFFSGGSKTSQGNVQEQIEINENGALVGTYRILLLKAHKRFSGPSAEEEIRRLRSFLAQSNQSEWCDGAELPQVYCSHCDFNASSSVLRSSSIKVQNGTENDVISDESTTPDLSTSQTVSNDSLTLNQNKSVRRTTRTKTTKTSADSKTRSNGTAVRSKFCVIL